MKKLMIHNSLYLEYLANVTMDTTGLDSLKACINKRFFLKYPNKISYDYNSRGFRDTEWPSDNKLKNCTWCLGDSFTVGLGQPLEETWPQLLQSKTNTRSINISMDGASNQWIARKAKYILNEINPIALIIQWSYITRRESSNGSLPDNERRIQGNIHKDNGLEFSKCILEVEKHKANTTVIHTFIPNWTFNDDTKSVFGQDGFWNLMWGYHELKDAMIAMSTHQLDFARDYHHYGPKTSARYVDDIIQLF